MRYHLRFSPLVALLMLGACATVPSGPSVMTLPGTGRSFDQFRADDFECRQFASAQVGGTTADQAASDSAVKSAVVGTAVGALAGAAIGGNSRGAAVGAGTGLLVGSLAGTGAAGASAYTAQQRYDVGYTQCMYAKGHKVPVSGRYASSPQRPPAAYAPPPPPPPPPR
ncbi:MAG: hypothetical protein A3G24_05455 [Betaproteobacteria bacterium RIFCSPLOWO2_12_FULL_62_13]|nr:MAG: hypothetical protein A3G24_05455 [Betaproteobacteria bacterium RIFCSPLOWO2_12_FULL_62_13]